MIRTQFVTAKSVVFALLLGAAAVSTTSAYALPHFGMHRHPADPNDSRVSMVIYNKGLVFRDVKIDGQIYTVLPGHTLTVKAPEGTPVYTNSTGALHRKGDLLFAVDRTMSKKTVSID